MKNINECIEMTERALYSCATTCALTRNVDDALKMAEAVEHLATARIQLKLYEEREETK